VFSRCCDISSAQVLPNVISLLRIFKRYIWRPPFACIDQLNLDVGDMLSLLHWHDWRGSLILHKKYEKLRRLGVARILRDQVDVIGGLIKRLAWS
jgi:hypothetical protein